VALLRCLIAGQAEASPGACADQDRGHEFAECGGQPEQRGGVDTELVVATTEVLNEGVPTDHDARRSVGLQSTHHPESCLQPAMVTLDPVVLVLAWVVQHSRNQVLDHARQRRAPGR
jgi:hypothetical protein